jgi:hypothetical protein
MCTTSRLLERVVKMGQGGALVPSVIPNCGSEAAPFSKQKSLHHIQAVFMAPCMVAVFIVVQAVMLSLSSIMQLSC